LGRPRRRRGRGRSLPAAAARASRRQARLSARLCPQPYAPDGTGTAGLQVTTFADPSPVVEIHGEIDIFSAPGLRDELLRVIRRHGPQLALDLAGVTFIDCAGVNVLLATRRRAGLENGSVDVIGASPRVRRVISLLGLEWAFGLR
jgi:anti-sigma B factor antagonist